MANYSKCEMKIKILIYECKQYNFCLYLFILTKFILRKLEFKHGELFCGNSMKNDDLWWWHLVQLYEIRFLIQDEVSFHPI